MVDESKLEIALKNSWTKETSSSPKDWTCDNPAFGQCAVTSLIVNDYLGGEIVWANVVLPDGKEISHYFNKINGTERDFTKVQFPFGTAISKGVPKTKEFPSTRDYILSYLITQTRYEILKQKVQELLGID